MLGGTNMYSFDEIVKADPEIAASISSEIQRQKTNIELIASENLVSKAVMAAMGSPHTNKYAEGYPGKRYYGGCEYVDIAENLAVNRAKELFGCEYVNVQPHSGVQANMATFFAVLKPGDTIVGMSLASGGHLSHGSPVNLSGKYYQVASYGLGADGKIDYDEVEDIVLRMRPRMLIAGASAYPRAIDFKKFREIADKTGAVLMADIAHIAGLVAAGEHMSPIPYAHVTTTTTHKTLRGPRGGMIMSNNAFEEEINFDKAIFPGIQGGPLMHVIAAKAICLKEALSPEFKKYQNQIVKNAKALAKSMMEKGFNVVSGGTDNHLILVDLRNKGITGKDAENILSLANITCNKNTVPHETQKPSVTSGIRLGTPTVTSRGMNEEDMKIIADCIDMMIINPDGNKDKVKQRIKELTDTHPIDY